MRYKPHPGIVVIEPITQQSEKLYLGENKTAKIMKGRVIAIGSDLLTEYGQIIPMKNYAKVGDHVYFLTYEGEYDKADDYHFVKIYDLRSVVHGKGNNAK